MARWTRRTLVPHGHAGEPGAATVARSRWRRVLSLLLVGVALLSIGMVTGWWLGTGHDASQVPEAQPTVIIEVPALPAAGAAVMPDLRGLDEQVSREILADIGVDTTALEVSSAPAAGPSGVVFAQTPAAGSAVSGEVALVLSSPVVVPELEGVQFAEAQRELSVLGASTVVTRIYQADSVAGTVISSEPPAGEALPTRVRLTVAEAPSSVYLSSLRSVEGGCNRGRAQVDGTTYDNSLSCRGREDGSTTAWVIARAADTFTAIVGVPDEADPNGRVQVTVRVDDVDDPIAVVEAAYGQPAELTASVSGALRMAVTVTVLGEGGSATAVLADARLVGGPDLLDRLGTS